MKIIEVYQYDELTPDVQEKVFQHWRNNHNDFIYWQDEISESLSEVLKAYRVYEYAENLTRQRALAWIENNVLSPLRVKYGLSHIRERKYNKAGTVPCCPFTGVCYDEDFIQNIREEILNGSTLKDAVNSCRELANHLLEKEYQYQISHENFLETESETLYTQTGTRI